MDDPARRALLAGHYGLPLPDDFFVFAEFARELASRDLALADEPLALRLGSAFDVFQPDFVADGFNPLWDSRYLNDPPEFLTVWHGHTDGLHWGYYVDDPAAAAFPVASYYHSDAFVIREVGEDLFAACRAHLETLARDVRAYLVDDPAEAAAYQRQLDRLDQIRVLLMRTATGLRVETGAAYLERYTPRRAPTAPTRDGMGIVVPPATYKPLAEATPLEAPDYVPTAAEVSRSAEAARRALAQGFAGTALKLGKDLWPVPQHFETACQVLDSAYAALQRPLLQRWLAVARDFRAVARSSRPPG
jgi:hypothetical protein